ncbi:unnamed protein product [Rotaria socialis]|uniref:Uncharacterized protein n=1 Tax=Rotaria socialis TaxID=392032 RepID=A0A817YDJ7_9BILA|nr:unnamed protein product [Rotaria socialis]CAF3377461.1 unnamed protein product [Rotaria socialis]CAF3636293.1 unnamed protein product [Rotaria socialis]CAF3679097.1 unnamed protein product [Rotaria socialis]CAF4419681.1 unnamed protein product [Rotaria socialis]
MNASSIVALDIIPDPENNQVFIFQQQSAENDISDVADVQVVDIDEDELEIELGLDFNDYYDADDDEEEEDYEEDYEDEDEIVQQLQTLDINQCPAA